MVYAVLLGIVVVALVLVVARSGKADDEDDGPGGMRRVPVPVTRVQPTRRTGR